MKNVVFTFSPESYTFGSKKINMTFTGRLFRRWYKICGTYVHQAAIGGGTTCPYEQLTPTSPIVHINFKDRNKD